MAILRKIMVLTVLSGGMGWAHALGSDAVIPPVHAMVLTGDKVDLPDGLHGKVAVLVLGFSQGSREQVAAWGRRLAGDYRDSPGVSYYEVAELESVPRLIRGWVLKKVKESVPERAHAHFMAVTDHEVEWKSAIAFKAPDDAYVVLVDANGNVRYRTQGPVTDASYNDLRGKVEALKPR